MKKRIILTVSILALICMFVFSEIFSIYYFGSIPTLFTILYLITIFFIFEYLFLTITYVIGCCLKKQKIGFKKILGWACLLFAFMLTLLFVVVVNVDWIHQYMYSSPFYLNVISRCIEFIVPAGIFGTVGILLMKKKNK